jgi:hypothetical protein
MTMKAFTYLLSLMTTLVLLGCESDVVNQRLNSNIDLSFSGTFKTINPDNALGTVTLEISNGYYQSTTNLPFGVGAGKLNIEGSTINFIDTLFFPIPAFYGPSYVLSGKHQYDFNGDTLKISRGNNVGGIEYELVLKK